MTGYLIAFVPAIVWGIMPLLWAVCAKTNNRTQMLGTGIGVFVISAIAVVIASPPMASPLTFIMLFLSGFLWMVGMYGQFLGYRTLGTAKTFPLSVGLQIILNALSGWLILHEWRGGRQVAQGLLGVLLTLIGIVLCNVVFPMKRMEKKELAPTITLVVTTLGYCMYSLIPKLFPTEDIMTPLLPQAMGILCAGIFFAAVMKNTGDPLPKPEAVRACLVGSLYGIATIAYLISIQINGMVRGFIIGQFNMVIATLLGIFILHEKREVGALRTAAGLVAIILGCGMIAII